MDDDGRRVANRIYNNLPATLLSLRDFNRRARDIYYNEDDGEAFIEFVLTGKFYDDNNQLRQAFLNPLANAVTADDQLKISRDYDSLLGICDTFMVTGNITVFAVPHPSFALKSSIHVTRTLFHEGEDHDVELHRIPNFEFGKFGPRHHLHIFFPGLWTPERAKARQPYLLTQHERDVWYNHGFRPAIVSLSENMAHEWPATCETEAIRARTARGTYSWATKAIPDHVVVRLADHIRVKLARDDTLAAEDRAWASTFFILHTARGTKAVTYHSTAPDSVEYYLGKFLRDSHLSRDIFTTGDWYIDVAIEISSDDDDCVLWTTAGHKRLVQQALRINDDNAGRITSVNSSKYSRDYSSHLSALSGFRIVPGQRAQGEFEAKYIQAYTTDKAVTYNNEGRHHGKFITAKEAMGTVQPTPMIVGLHTIFNEARVYNGCNARVEVRVPIEFAREVLVEFDPSEIRRCLCLFSRNTWWTFRMTRLMGASQALSLQATGPAELRVGPQALTLTAACVWLVNGLHSRPEDGPAARQLMDAALPVTEADEVDLDNVAYRRSLPRQRIIQRDDREPGDEDVEDLDDGDDDDDDDGGGDYGEVAYNPYGLVFFRRIKVNDVPRFRHGGPVLLDGAFKFWFGMAIEEIEAKYSTTGMVDRAIVAQTRSTSNKGRLPRTYYADEPQPDIFAIGDRDQMLPPPVIDPGSDVDDAETPPPPEHVDKFLSDLFRKFVIDLTCKSPNPRGNTSPSYLRLTTAERLTATEDLYKTVVLSDVFTHVAYKVTSVDDWNLAFKWLFPDTGLRTSTNIQNYPSAPYYKKWLSFVNNPEIDKKVIQAARKAIWKRIRTWSWIPDAQQDKMWPTSLKNVSGFTRCPDLRSNGRSPDAAPRILVNAAAGVVFYNEPQE